MEGFLTLLVGLASSIDIYSTVVGAIRTSEESKLCVNTGITR